MVIKGLGTIAAATPGGGRAGAGAAGFAVPAGASRTNAPAAVSATALDGLLALQEHDGPTGRDRRARQHGRAMLDALARLQLGLLGADPDGRALATLAALVEHCPEAADPCLRDAVAAVGLRARIEMARRGLC